MKQCRHWRLAKVTSLFAFYEAYDDVEPELFRRQMVSPWLTLGIVSRKESALTRHVSGLRFLLASFNLNHLFFGTQLSMSIDYASLFGQGLTYRSFLDRHANEAQLGRWAAVHAKVQLGSDQQSLLESFTREMKVLVSTGAWCGDCINQCPIFDHFAAANDKIQVRFFDRDEYADFAESISTCGAHRVPSVLFLSEDNFVCGRYGDRTLATYRHMAETQLGPSCPTGIGAVNTDLLTAVTAEWLGEFERIQLMLRLSGRLREQHGD